jgi:CAAX prenyl protease-like protein
MSRERHPFHSIVAFNLPFLLYVGLTMFESSPALGLNYEWVCTLKGVLAAIALYAFRRSYPEFSNIGIPVAIAAGILGFGIWIALERLQASLPAMKVLSGWLLQGSRAGFDPFSNGGPSTAQVAFVGVRLIELAVIVPLIEEIFWRGFLSRYLISDDFETVVPGTFTAFSFIIVTVAFTFVHPEILAALGWCAMINLLYWWTRNLWACIVMHAVTNGLLGAYVLMTKNWHLW